MLRVSERMGRLGTETAFEVLARAEALARGGRDVINLGIGQPDFKTPPHVVEAAVRALRDGHHGYTPAPGIPALREAVAADLAARRGVEVDPARFVVVPGGKVTMFFAILMFGEPGAEVMYPNPGFPIYESVIEFTGAKAVPTPLLEEQDFSFDAEAVLAAVTPATRLIILNTPANPTGGAVPKGEIDKLAAGLAKHPGVAVLSDEIYSRILYDGREHASLLTYPEIADRVILLDGWSKTYAMTGWRLGYAVWPAGLAERAAQGLHQPSGPGFLRTKPLFQNTKKKLSLLYLSLIFFTLLAGGLRQKEESGSISVRGENWLYISIEKRSPALTHSEARQAGFTPFFSGPLIPGLYTLNWKDHQKTGRLLVMVKEGEHLLLRHEHLMND